MFSITLNKKKSRKINNIEYKSNFELKPISEISLIKKTEDTYFLYSPLNLKIYILSKGEYRRFRNNSLDESEKKSFFEDDMLIMKGVNPYPNIKINIVSPVIFLTSKCNLKCVYCFSKGGDLSIDNSFERIKRFIDFWKDSPKYLEKKNISFFSSGEPTLAFELLKKTYSYVNRILRKKVKASLVSNGTFSKSVADWIIKNDINLQISCDGPPYIQDFQRPLRNGSRSSKIVENNIKYLVKMGYKNFHVHSVITRDFVDNMDEILNYFHKLGVNNVTFSEMFVYGRAKKELFMNMDKYVENLMKVIELSKAYGIRCSSSIIPLKAYGKFCSAGRMLILCENGAITACQNALGNDKVSEFFTIGEYDKKTDKIKLDEKKRMLIAKRTTDKIEKCKNCMFRWNCGGGCPFYAFHEHNTLFSVDYGCNATKSAYKNFLNYRIQKDFIKIKPALEIIGGKLCYSMIFNKFELSQTNNDEVKPNSFIQISERANLDILAKKIMSARNSNRYKTSVFLLSFNLSGRNLNRGLGDKIVKFLEELKKNRIFFVVAKPFCRQLFGENHNRILNEFKIPKNWFESIELFKLRGSKAVLRDGKIVEIKNSTKREDIYRKFKEDATKETRLPFKKCKSCIYGIRKNCGYRFFI